MIRTIFNLSLFLALLFLWFFVIIAAIVTNATNTTPSHSNPPTYNVEWYG